MTTLLYVMLLLAGSFGVGHVLFVSPACTRDVTTPRAASKPHGYCVIITSPLRHTLMAANLRKGQQRDK